MSKFKRGDVVTLKNGSNPYHMEVYADYPEGREEIKSPVVCVLLSQTKNSNFSLIKYFRPRDLILTNNGA